MTTWFVYLSYLAAVNPARLRPALPGRDGRAAVVPLVTGAVITLAFASLLIGVADDVLDALDITPETFRIAAGVVAGLVGIKVLALPTRAEEPELSGVWKALVPVTFPLMITPELVALASIYGATESGGVAIGGVAIALLAGAGAGLLRQRRPRLWLASARFLAAFLILAGFALVVEGIRDV